MDIIESIKNDKAYLKSKLIVKNWEKEFKTKHSRTPSKFDIKEAPSKIKYAYKKYFQLKSAALENSLSVCDFEEEAFGSPEPAPHLENGSCALSPRSEQILPILPSGQELEKLLSKAEVIQGKDGKMSPFAANLSKKLFQNRKFSLRNPRKLSMPKSQSLLDNSSSSTILENNSLEVFDNTFEKDSIDEDFNVSFTMGTNTNNKSLSTSGRIGSFGENIVTPPVRQLNKAWLDRASGLNFQQPDNKYDTSEKFGLTNINISSADKPCDYVENSESDEEDKTIDKLKPALKKRKLISGDSSMLTHTINRHVNCDNDDIKAKSKSSAKNDIDNPQSNQEISKKTKKTRNSLKSDANDKEQQPPDIAEYLPFGIEKNVAPRHSSISNVLKSIVPIAKSDVTNDSNNLDKLENKIKSGTLNENFVKINIEKKVFVRGKKGINFSKYKKQQWKDKKALHAGMEFPESGKITCFKCGSTGHMARYCSAQKSSTLLPLDSYEDDNTTPTLEDMQNFVSQDSSISISEQLSKSFYEPSPIPESFMKMLSDTPANSNGDSFQPIYSNCITETPADMMEALQKFGHTSFRPGQEQAIKRILCGMSTLLILSTGSGKSLCYQLPAYIYSQHYKCITLVISPLVSLMEDQVLSMPEFLKAGCLHTNQPPTQRKKIIQCLKEGQINILLISPEALVSSDTSNGFAGLFKSLPPIAFACIDEAHCVSQWSHNFRPSYLMICRVLREKLNVKCILGLTATASRATIKSIISHIDIPDEMSGVITNPNLPDNLCLSVSFERDKDRALVSYLSSERIELFNSIIVYCIRRDECERVAAILRSCLQEPGKTNMETDNKKRKRMSYIAEAYHAGMSAAQRKKIQKHFMDGTLRIIVATVAFGMGINKPDIRCIIHYNMPSSFESFVQEVGRAGRDGKPAYCHVFMNNSNNDKNELLKHIHANTIDRPVIRKLLQKVFIPCECVSSDNSTTRCKGHEVGIPIDSTVEELDLPSENIATLLCYVELHPKQYIKVLNNAYTMCKISSYGGPQKILQAANNCRPLAMAYLLESKKDPDVMKKSILEFPVIEVAAAIGWESGMTKYHLKNLEWITEGGTSKRSHLKVEFQNLGFRIKAQGDLNATELDSILDDLHGLVLSQEKTKLYQLEEIIRAFHKLGDYSLENKDISEDFFVQKSDELKLTIRDYFQRDNNVPENITLEQRPLDTERVTSDVRAMISSYKDCSFTGRSIARIFQGISSPNYPALVWGRCKFWRSHIHEDFYGIIKIATQQIIQMKMI